MGLVRNFKASTYSYNNIGLTWDQPLSFSDTTDQIIVTKSNTHFPVELFNTVFPTKATDPRPIEIFRGSVIAQTDPSGVTVSGSTLMDSNADFPISPPLNGRLLRGHSGNVFRILSNTATSLTVQPLEIDLNGTIVTVNPAVGKYIILADFPQEVRAKQQLYSAVASAGQLASITQFTNNVVTPVTFIPDELANLIFVDAINQEYIIKSNTTDTIYFFESSATVATSSNMYISTNFLNSSPYAYIDTFATASQVVSRRGTGLLDDVFYYYTSFVIPLNVNVAQAQFDLVNSSTSTQAGDLSIRYEGYDNILYNLWPGVFKELDTTEDLQDLMAVFGFQFNLLHCLITSYNLQDPQTVFYTALLALSEQSGLPTIGYALGIDTLRRVANEIITCYKMKGSKEGIARFIRVLTTWDITNGTGDYSDSIIDGTSSELLFAFWSNMGDLVHDEPPTPFVVPFPFVDGGQFIHPIPGIVISGFSSVRFFSIDVQNVALIVGSSANVTFTTNVDNTTTMTDTSANFGATNGLVGNFLLPHQQEYNNLYQIVSNTSTTIKVKGIVSNLQGGVYGDSYAVLSPLNSSRFIALNAILPQFIPVKTKASISFT